MSAPARSRRALAALLVAEAVSTAGTRMSQLALPWLVLTTTGDPVSAGLVGLAEIAPFVVMQFLGAPLVDRFGGRRVAVTGNLAAGAAMLCVPLLWSAGSHDLAPVLVLVFLAGLFRGPADTATQVMLPAVTALAETTIERSAALFEGASRTATLIGAPVGAVLIGVLGAANVVVLDAVSFLAAGALLLCFVPSSAGQTRAQDADRRYLGQLIAGITYVARDRLLRSIAAMVLFANLADAALSGLLLLLWVQERYGEADRLGLVIAAMGAGALAGTALIAVAGARVPRRWTFAVAFLIAGAPRFAILAFPAPFWSVLLVWGISGVAAGAINPLLAAAEYETIPRELQARVLSAVGAIAWAGMPFGALLAGVLVNATSLSTALLVGAAVYALATLDPFIRPVWAQMDRQPGR